MQPRPSSPHRDRFGSPAPGGTRPRSVLGRPDHRESAKVVAFPRPALTAEVVPDRIEEVAAADGELADELDLIGATTTLVSELIVSRLEVLLDRLRPAARLRTELGELDAELLNAAASVGAARRATAAGGGTTP
jgi:hypothetical protein